MERLVKTFFSFFRQILCVDGGARAASNAGGRVIKYACAHGICGIRRDEGNHISYLHSRAAAKRGDSRVDTERYSNMPPDAARK
jgi:hypothetical protein